MSSGNGLPISSKHLRLATFYNVDLDVLTDDINSWLQEVEVTIVRIYEQSLPGVGNNLTGGFRPCARVMIWYEVSDD